LVSHNQFNTTLLFPLRQRVVSESRYAIPWVVDRISIFGRNMIRCL